MSPLRGFLGDFRLEPVISRFVTAVLALALAGAAQSQCNPPKDAEVAVRCYALQQRLAWVVGVPREQWNRVWFIANAPLLPRTTILPNYHTFDLFTGEVGPAIEGFKGARSHHGEIETQRILAYWAAYRQQVFDINRAGRLAFGPYPCTFDCSGHQAGYDWAAERNISAEPECDSGSKRAASFRQGCQVFVELNRVL